MIASRQIFVRKYDCVSEPPRIAVGDVIRCGAFRLGLREKSGEIIVAWAASSYAEYRARAGTGTLADDETRGSALFLVSSISLVEDSGPDDVFPGNHRLTRDVRCLRLTNESCLVAEPERIRFALDEPMSVIRPAEREINVVGYAELPISWGEPRQ